MFAVAYFAWRGVWRGATNSEDLAVAYSGARAWLLGHDPYDVARLTQDLYLAGGASIANSGMLSQLRNVDFPTTLPLVALLALVSWPEAKMLGLVINVVASAFIALGLSQLLGWRLTSSKALILAAFVLISAPVESTIAVGQTAIVATAAIVAGMLCERAGRRAESGFMYGIATAIKIQIGLPFVAYLLWRRRWAPALVSCLELIGLTALAVARMQVARVAWLNAWLTNLAWVSRPGGINDFSRQNPGRYLLINLQYPLSSLIANGAFVQLLTFGAVAVAALAFIWMRRGRDPHPDLLALAIVAVLGLLVVYHRNYDAVLVAIPIAWACSLIGTARWRLGALVLALCVDFVLPFQTVFYDIQGKILPSSVTAGVFWTAGVLAQQVWALVAIAIVLLVAAARDRRPVSPSPPVPARPRTT